MNEYAVIFERADDGSISVWVPDLPGCTSCGDTYEEAHEMIREAIGLYIETTLEHGECVPPPTSRAAMVRVPQHAQAA